MRSHLQIPMLVALLVPALLRAQDGQHPFVRGPCAASDSALAPGSYVEQPERLPALKSGATFPSYPDTVRTPGYSGRVVVAFVVEANGRVRPGSVAVISSTDPVLSRWACTAVLKVRFVPGRVRGKAVASQAVMPFEYRSAPPAAPATPPAAPPSAPPPVAPLG